MVQLLKIKVMAVMCTLFTLSAVAQSYKEVTMSAVGDSDVLSPFVGVIKESQVGSILFDGISYVQVTSYTNRSVTVKAVKAYSSPVIVRCDYCYLVNWGLFMYICGKSLTFNALAVKIIALNSSL